MTNAPSRNPVNHYNGPQPRTIRRLRGRGTIHGYLWISAAPRGKHILTLIRGFFRFSSGKVYPGFPGFFSPCGYPFKAIAMPLATAISMRFQWSSSSHLAVPRLSAEGSAPAPYFRPSLAICQLRKSHCAFLCRLVFYAIELAL